MCVRLQRNRELELENATVSADREPLFQLNCYTPLYEKDTKQTQNKSMDCLIGFAHSEDFIGIWDELTKHCGLV